MTDKEFIKFSIVVPFYNNEKYLKRCLDSIKSQSYNNYEVILINDGSTDNSESICKDFLKDKRFKYYKNEINRGVGYSREFGKNIIDGDYLIFIDSDDWVDNNHLEKIFEGIEKYGEVDFIKVLPFKQSSIKDFIDYIKKDFIKADDEFLVTYLKDNPKNAIFGYSWSLVRKSSIVKNCHYIDGGMDFKRLIFPETEFNIETAILSKTFVFIDSNTYHHKVTENSLTLNMGRFTKEDKFFTQRLMLENFEKFKKDYKVEDYYEKMFLQYLRNIIPRDYNLDVLKEID